MKNYYEILEVDKKASQDVIEKVYRVLAKKYHPDLQENDNKEQYAEKMKIINEAYDVLSNNEKRTEYDKELFAKVEEEQMFLKQQYEQVIREKEALINELKAVGNKQIYNVQNDNPTVNMNSVLEQEINAVREKAYRDAYIQDLKNRGYKIRYHHDFKYYLKQIILIVVMIFIFYLVYQIPVVKGYFRELYNENSVFQAIINVIRDTFFTKF